MRLVFSSYARGTLELPIPEGLRYKERKHGFEQEVKQDFVVKIQDWKSGELGSNPSPAADYLSDLWLVSLSLFSQLPDGNHNSRTLLECFEILSWKAPYL